MIAMADELLTTAEAAKRADLNPRYISMLVRTGKIAGRKRGRDWFVDADSLSDFLKQPRKPGPKAPFGPRGPKEPT